MRIAVSRAPGAERVVTPLELFFDLVYVFAIGQLSHHLLEHVDLRTGAETAIMTLAVVYAWYMTAWGANWLDPDRLPVRLLLVGLMFASLLMSVAIADAFDDRAWLFVTGYLLLQIGRSAFLIVALRGRALGDHFVNDLVWEVAHRLRSGWPARSPTATPGSRSGAPPSWRPTSARGPALAARPWPRDRPRPHRDRRRASHRALPAVLHHRARRDRADDGHRVHRASRSSSSACSRWRSGSPGPSRCGGATSTVPSASASSWPSATTIPAPSAGGAPGR